MKKLQTGSIKNQHILQWQTFRLHQQQESLIQTA